MSLASQIAKGHASLKEAAVMINVSYQTIRKMADRKEILTIKVGKHSRVTISEVERFLQYGNYDPSTPQPLPNSPSQPKGRVEEEGNDRKIPTYIHNLNRNS